MKLALEFTNIERFVALQMLVMGIANLTFRRVSTDGDIESN